MQYWADQIIADHAFDAFVFNDSKTCSGSAHVGSLRGPVVHDLLLRSALDAGRRARFNYGNDDMDALDSIPPVLSAKQFKPWLGSRSVMCRRRMAVSAATRATILTNS